VPGSWRPGNIRDMHQAEQINVLLQFGDEVALGYLLVEKIVEQLDAGMACLPHHLEAFGNGSEKVFRVFFGVDGLQQDLDALRRSKISDAFQALHAIGVHLFVGQARNAVAGKQNEARRLKFGKMGSSARTSPSKASRCTGSQRLA